MVSEKIYDPDEKRKEEERKKEKEKEENEKEEKEKKEALKEAFRKEEEQKMQDQKMQEQKMQDQKDRLEQINTMRRKIEELRNEINSTEVSNDLKQGPLKKLDEAENYLKSAEEQIESNNIKDGIGNIDNAQRSIDAAELEYQINKMKGEIENREKSASKLPENQKNEVLEKLGDAKNFLNSAEKDLENNNIYSARDNINNAQKSIDATSYWLSQDQNKDQSLGMGI